MNRRCSQCIWFVLKQKVGEDSFGTCHRKAPGIHGFSVVSDADWCGEHSHIKIPIRKTDYFLDFGQALDLLKIGKKVARRGWNGKGMWIALSASAPFPITIPQEAQIWSESIHRYVADNGGDATVLPCITMKTDTGEILMGWLASQTDMLADDWQIIE